MKDNKMKAIATLKICLGKEFCISCAPSALARKQSLAGDVFIRVVHHCEKQSHEPASLKAGRVKLVILHAEWEKL